MKCARCGASLAITQAAGDTFVPDAVGRFRVKRANGQTEVMPLCADHAKVMVAFGKIDPLDKAFGESRS